jgi:hypothetical protein
MREWDDCIGSTCLFFHGILNTIRAEVGAKADRVVLFQGRLAPDPHVVYEGLYGIRRIESCGVR